VGSKKRPNDGVIMDKTAIIIGIVVLATSPVVFVCGVILFLQGLGILK